MERRKSDYKSWWIENTNHEIGTNPNLVGTININALNSPVRQTSVVFEKHSLLSFSRNRQNKISPKNKAVENTCLEMANKQRADIIV